MTTIDNEIKQKLSNKYYCEKCDYGTSRRSNITSHIMSAKHQKTTLNNVFSAKTSNISASFNKYCCKKCDKKFNDRAGLWRHNKKCNYDNIDTNTNTNNDLIQHLINENKEFKNLILEIVKKDSITNNNTNNINSHNKTFNLQIFLNETCKDAMNLSEFIDSMKLQLSDLESVGKLGFVDGISNIIINNLKALDIEKRPVHCSDSKRETMYIKDQDKWEKEDEELNKMKQMVRQVRDKNISLITSWRDLYPECLLSNSNKTDQYNDICTESFGFKKEREEKIISKIAKSVIIDKK